MIHDGLWSSFLEQHMGEGTDEVSAELGLSRLEQDAWAARSHQRADAAWGSGSMADEVVSMEVKDRKGAVALVDRDEGIRPETTPETLGRLKPAFRADGTITAGNASQISDGACAVVVMSADRAEELGPRRSPRSSPTACRPIAIPRCTRCRRWRSNERSRDPASPHRTSGSSRSTRRSPPFRSTPRGCSVSTRTS